MARAAIRQVVLWGAAAALLSGCVEGEGPFAAASKTGAETATVTPERPRRGGNRDVEAPDVFQVTDTALWDGRPSLGGVWVASPDVTDPERVIMRNPANGQSVVGALFRRERDNPGPALQISSDAAEALGLLAGQPAELSVIALRREEADEPEAVAEPEALATAEAVAEPAAAPEAEAEDTAAPAGTAAIAAAALDAVDADSTAAGPAADGDTAAAVAEAAEPPKKKTWKERRAEARAAREAAKAAKAAEAAGTAGAVGAEAVATSPIIAAVETAPLDARSPDVAEAAPAAASVEPSPASEKRKTRRQIKAEAEAEAAAAAAAAAAPPAPEPIAAAPAPTPGRPIQIGFFAEQANADRTVATLAKAGVPATARKEESNGKAYWTVTARGDADILQKAKAAGFADAYFLK